MTRLNIEGNLLLVVHLRLEDLRLEILTLAEEVVAMGRRLLGLHAPYGGLYV